MMVETLSVMLLLGIFVTKTTLGTTAILMLIPVSNCSSRSSKDSLRIWKMTSEVNELLGSWVMLGVTTDAILP